MQIAAARTASLFFSPHLLTRPLTHTPFLLALLSLQIPGAQSAPLGDPSQQPSTSAGEFCTLGFALGSNGGSALDATLAVDMPCNQQQVRSNQQGGCMG